MAKLNLLVAEVVPPTYCIRRGRKMNSKLSFELVLLALMTISFIGVQSANAITLTPTQHDCIKSTIIKDVSAFNVVAQITSDTTAQYKAMLSIVDDVENCLK